MPDYLRRGHARARLIVAVVFVLAGVLHFVIAPFYLAMMPPWLPAHPLLVQLSGVAEIVLGQSLGDREPLALVVSFGNRRTDEVTAAILELIPDRRAVRRGSRGGHVDESHAGREFGAAEPE